MAPRPCAAVARENVCLSGLGSAEPIESGQLAGVDNSARSSRSGAKDRRTPGPTEA